MHPRPGNPLIIPLVLTVVALSFSQQNSPTRTQPQDSPSMVLRVTTHLVVVDAIVTDRSGNPASDLKKEDFKLFENGKAQDIQVFSFQRMSSSSESRPVRRTLPVNVYTNVPAPNSPAGPPTVLLIDGVNTPTSDRVYLREQLIKYIQAGLHNRALPFICWDLVFACSRISPQIPSC